MPKNFEKYFSEKDFYNSFHAHHEKLIQLKLKAFYDRNWTICLFKNFNNFCWLVKDERTSLITADPVGLTLVLQVKEWMPYLGRAKKLYSPKWVGLIDSPWNQLIRPSQQSYLF